MWGKWSLVLLLACWPHSSLGECYGDHNYTRVTCDTFNDLEDFQKRENVQSLTIHGQISPKPCLFPMLPGFGKLTSLKYDYGYTGMVSSSCFAANPHLMFLRLNHNRILTVSFETFNRGPIKKLSLNNNEIRQAPLNGVVMAKLEELDLSKNHLQSFEIDAINAPLLKKLFLRGNKIKTIKLNCPRATEVHLQHNLIESFEPSDLILPKVERLFFSRNRLIVMSPDMLELAPKLTWLTLESNALFNVGFPRNNEIQNLNLRNNQIRTMDAIILGKLSSNQSLVDLSSNQLEELKSTQSRPNNNIDHFICMNCGIKFIFLDIFCYYMPNLRILNLANNFITTLDIFSCSPALVHIDLGYNLIDEIRSKSLERVSELETLSLKFNKIGTIGPGSFDNLPKLRNVSLEYNCIRQVYDNWLFALRSVPHLRLDANLLTYFPVPGDNSIQTNGRAAFTKPPQLRWNPLQCSCYDSLLSWIASSNTTYSANFKFYESEGHRPVCIATGEPCSRTYNGEKFFREFKPRIEGIYNNCDL